jgi:hypothetical protein
LGSPFFNAWQLLAFSLGLGCDTWKNLLSPPLLGHDAAARLPVNLDILSKEDLHQHEVVLVFREKAENLAACHQLACGGKDNANAKVFWVTLNLYAVEVRRRVGWAIHGPSIRRALRKRLVFWAADGKSFGAQVRKKL